MYINPLTELKESFLNREAVKITRTKCKDWDEFKGPILPVCLVNNLGFFNTAGVLFSADERDAFIGEDGKPKVFYTIDKNKLLDVTPPEEHKLLGKLFPIEKTEE